MMCENFPAKRKGFTLAELLISLAILGVISTFAISKVLQAQQNSEWNSIAKEAAGTFAAAYEALKREGKLSANTSAKHLIPYMNYVKYDTSSQVDKIKGGTFWNCTATYPCIHLHNGAVLYFESRYFNGTEPNRAIWMLVDPEAGYSGSTTGPGKSIWFAMYYGGRLATRSTINPNTVGGADNFVWNPCANCDPPWFSWD